MAQLKRHLLGTLFVSPAENKPFLNAELEFCSVLSISPWPGTEHSVGRERATVPAFLELVVS